MNPYKYLNSLDKFGSKGGYKPGLERINTLLERLGNPQNNLSVVHVGGTNGKGSTVSFLESIYQAAGYRTGSYISPHLYHFNERIKVQQKTISRTEIERLLEEIKPIVKDMEMANKFNKPSYFEVITALAFLYFSRQKLDLVFLEVGLGGRFDATNVIKPLVSVITSIDLEHTELLGRTTAKIAFEKAGIIKNEVPIVSSVLDFDARQVIKEQANLKNSKLYETDYYLKKISGSNSINNNYLRFEESNQIHAYRLGLNGEHQARNAAAALLVTRILEKEFPLVEEEIRHGLASVKWPGRLEVICTQPQVIIDGAHNPSGMASLTDFLLANYKDYQKIIFIFSMLNDKDLPGVLNELKRIEKHTIFMLAENNSSRSISICELEKYFANTGFAKQIYPDLDQAVEAAFAKNKQLGKTLIVIAGSFFTVVEAGMAAKRFCSQV